MVLSRSTQVLSVVGIAAVAIVAVGNFRADLTAEDTVAPLPPCIDSDAGASYDVPGAVTLSVDGEQSSHFDECVNGRLLREFFCGDLAALDEVFVDCPNGCVDGACADVSQYSCEDSDGGVVYSAAGTIAGVWNGEPYSYTEECTADGRLLEYSCDGPLAYSQGADGVECPGGCVDGACADASAEFSCTDGDGGIEPSWRGDVQGVDHFEPYTLSDRCIDDHWLTEYYCDGDLVRQAFPGIFGVYCPGGCLDGSCIMTPEFTCTDSDGGDTPSEQGTVSGYWQGAAYAFTEECLDDRRVSEFHCNGTTAEAVVPDVGYECPFGCEAGRCLPE